MEIETQEVITSLSHVAQLADKAELAVTSLLWDAKEVGVAVHQYLQAGQLDLLQTRTALDRMAVSLAFSAIKAQEAFERFSHAVSYCADDLQNVLCALLEEKVQ
mgnify:CR=1 FL=1